MIHKVIDQYGRLIGLKQRRFPQLKCDSGLAVEGRQRDKLRKCGSSEGECEYIKLR